MFNYYSRVTVNNKTNIHNSQYEDRRLPLLIGRRLFNYSYKYSYPFIFGFATLEMWGFADVEYTSLWVCVQFLGRKHAEMWRRVVIEFRQLSDRFIINAGILCKILCDFNIFQIYTVMWINTLPFLIICTWVASFCMVIQIY